MLRKLTKRKQKHKRDKWYIWHAGAAERAPVADVPALHALQWDVHDDRIAFVRTNDDDGRNVTGVVALALSKLKKAPSNAHLDALATTSKSLWPAWFNAKAFARATPATATADERWASNDDDDDADDGKFVLYWPHERMRSRPMSGEQLDATVSMHDRERAVASVPHLHPSWPVVPSVLALTQRQVAQRLLHRSDGDNQLGNLDVRLLRFMELMGDSNRALPPDGSDACLSQNGSLEVVSALGTETTHAQGDVFLATTNTTDRLALKRFLLPHCPPRHLDDPLHASALQEVPFIERLVLAMCSELVRQRVVPNLPLYYGWFHCSSDARECAPQQAKMGHEGCACLYVAAEYAPLGNLHAYLTPFANEQSSVAPAQLDLAVRSLFFQVLAGTYALHRHMGVVHGDLRWENVLLHPVTPSYGGYWHYRIGGNDYYVPNYGVLAVLWDFGVSALPKRGISNPVYANHYAEKRAEVGGGALERIDLQSLFYWPPLAQRLQEKMGTRFFDDALDYVHGDKHVRTDALIMWLFGAFMVKPPKRKDSPLLGTYDLDAPFDRDRRVPPALATFFTRA